MARWLRGHPRRVKGHTVGLKPSKEMPSGQEPLLRAKSSVVEPQLCRATNERARLERLRQYFDHKIRFRITLQYIKTTSALFANALR